MKKEIPLQLIVGLAIVVVGGVFLGGEYFWVKWAPVHKQRTADEALKMLPYHNDALGIDMQVAAGIFGKAESFPGGVKIFRPRFWGVGPSLTITSQPNPDSATEFSQEILAKWMTDGDYQHLPRYHFEQTKLMNRDTVLIQQYKDHAMLLSAHVMSPDRIIVADCSTGGADAALYMDACDESLRTIKVAGPEPGANAPKLEEASAPGNTPPRIITH